MTGREVKGLVAGRSMIPTVVAEELIGFGDAGED